jgi:hypothetical protein
LTKSFAYKYLPLASDDQFSLDGSGQGHCLFHYGINRFGSKANPYSDIPVSELQYVVTNLVHDDNFKQNIFALAEYFFINLIKGIPLFKNRFVISFFFFNFNKQIYCIISQI